MSPVETPPISHAESAAVLSAARAHPPARAGYWWLLLLLAGVLVYASALSGGFVGLDPATVQYNPHLRLLIPPRVPLGAPDGGWLAGAPLASYSLALNHAVGGLDPRGYLAVNVALHLAAALLLFGLVRRCLLSPKFVSAWAGRANVIAAVLALLWLVHPVAGDAVRQISARPLLLAGCWTLAALYGFVRAAEGTGKPAWAILSILCAVGAVLSHPLSLAVPLVALLLDRAVLAGSLVAALRSRWLVYAALLLTLVIPLSVILGGRLVSDNTPGPPLNTYLMMAALAPGHTLWQAFAPFTLAAVYDDIWLAPGTTRNVLAGVSVVVLLAAGWWLWQNTLAGVLAVTLILCSIPAALGAGLHEYPGVPFASYIALMAVVGLLLIVGMRLIGRAPAAAQGLVVAVLVLGLGGLNVQHAAAYRNDEAYWSDTLARRPASVAAHRGLARALTQNVRGDQLAEELPRALELLERAAELAPRAPAVFIQLAQVRGLKRDTLGATSALRTAEELAEGRFHLLRQIERTFLNLALYDDALRLLRDHLERFWRDVDAHLMMAELRLARNQPKEAARHLEEAVKIDGRSAPALSALGLQHIRDNLLDDAAERLREAIRIAPQFAESHFNLGQALIQSKRPADAVAPLRMAVRLEERNPIVHHYLGMALQLAGEPAAAEASYEAALVLDPNLIPAMNNLAWLYATSADEAHRDPVRAVELAEKVRDAGGKYVPTYADTLAAAYAAAGRFEEAIEAAQLSIDLWQRSENPQAAREVEPRLALYKKQTMYVESSEP